MGVKVTNNAYGTLSAGIASGDTTITLDSGQGARFPTLGAGDYFYGTLVDTSNNIEVVKVTARSTDSMTVVRGQDNTSANAYVIGDRFELRPTAALFNDIAAGAEVVNDTTPQLGGDLDLNSNDITGTGNIDITGSITTSSQSIFGGNDGTNAYTQVIIRNTQLPPSAGATSQTATVAFELGADDGGTVEYKTAGKIEIYKDNADWDTGSPSANFQSGIKFYSREDDVLTEQAKIDSNGLFYMDSGYGSVVPAYGIRAWLYYQGDTNSIYASQGVSSVTKQGTGQYVVNFSFTFPDTNYILIGESFDGGGQNDIREINSSFNAPGKSTTQHQFYCLGMTTGPSSPVLDDSAHIQIIAVR